MPLTIGKPGTTSPHPTSKITRPSQTPAQRLLAPAATSPADEETTVGEGPAATDAPSESRTAPDSPPATNDPTKPEPTPATSSTTRRDVTSRADPAPPTAPTRATSAPASPIGGRNTPTEVAGRQDPTSPSPKRRWGTGDRWIRLATVIAVLGVAGIAAVVSYRHMRAVAILHGEDPTNAAVIPLSVDGLIIAASMTMLADSRAHRHRSWLAYALLTLASAASLAANVMHAQPDLAARVIAAWPSAALIGAYELLTAQIRAAVTATPQSSSEPAAVSSSNAPHARPTPTPAPSDAPNSRASAAPAASPNAEPTTAPAGKRRNGPGTSPTPPPTRPGTKKDRLQKLLAALPPDDPRSVYALARDLAPLIGLHEGTARRYIPHLRL